MSLAEKGRRQVTGTYGEFYSSARPLTPKVPNKCSLLSLSIALLLVVIGVRYSPPFPSFKASSEGTREMTDYSVVYVTVPSLEQGKKIGRALVEEKLAACVNIIPGITSIYRWQEQVDEDSELLLMIKTQTKLQESLTNRVNALHPYDVPEVIAVPIVDGSSEYLNWIKNSTEV